MGSLKSRDGRQNASGKVVQMAREYYYWCAEYLNSAPGLIVVLDYVFHFFFPFHIVKTVAEGQSMLPHVFHQGLHCDGDTRDWPKLGFFATSAVTHPNTPQPILNFYVDEAQRTALWTFKIPLCCFALRYLYVHSIYFRLFSAHSCLPLCFANPDPSYQRLSKQDSRRGDGPLQR